MNIFILLIKNEVVVEWLYLVFPIFEPTSLQWYNKQDWSQSMTDIIAHRGSKGTHPENTCIAFRETVRVGAEGIELDVHLSKDGYLIVMHDETVDRTTDGHGEIQQLTLNELKQLDAGSWFQKNPSVQCVPTLEDVLKCLEEEQFNGFLNIELKTDIIHYEGIEKKVVQQMNQKNWPFRFLFSEFS